MDSVNTPINRKWKVELESREVISRGLSYDHKWENLFKMSVAMNSVFRKEVKRRLFSGSGMDNVETSD